MPAWVKQDYHRFPRARVRNGRTVEVLSTLAQANWQADAKGGPLSGLAFGRDRPAMVFHDPAAHGQAQAGPAVLGRDEGLEDLFEKVGRELALI